VAAGVRAVLACKAVTAAVRPFRVAPRLKVAPVWAVPRLEFRPVERFKAARVWMEPRLELREERQFRAAYGWMALLLSVAQVAVTERRYARMSRPQPPR
jgi:hypothetical protein